MDKQMFLDVADVVEAEDAFNMQFFLTDNGAYGTPKGDGSVVNCGTTACVCGWVNFMIRPDTDPNGLEVDYAAEWSAAKALGIDTWQANRLFYCSRNSVWVEVAEEFGWATDDGGIVNWSDIKAWQAAIVLRRIANGTLELRGQDEPS